MKPETLEWIAKAEGDLGTASREVAVVDKPNFDAVCFHSQQCGEKYLKALLVEQGLAVPRVHDLEVLVNLLLPCLPLQQEVMSSARILTSMAVEVRYPGLQADEGDAVESLAAAKNIRAAARKVLGGRLADVLKKEEQKVLYEAFSLAGEDADVEFAVSAQREASERHE